MTQQEFWTELKKCKGFCVYNGEIRRLCDGACPITAVCERVTGHEFNSSEYCKAACCMKLNFTFAHKVVESSDNDVLAVEHYKLRNKLLRALKIKEPAA